MAVLLWVYTSLAFASAANLSKMPGEAPKGLENEFESFNPVEVDGEELFDGDILLTQYQRTGMKMKKAISSLNSRWTDGPDGYPLVLYRYIDDLIDKDAVELGINHWQEHTCIKFKETDENETEPHLMFHKGSGCWSYIGMIGSWSGQRVSIGGGCNYLGIVAHEIGHSLGFFHEQSRSDRDDYVRVNEDNVIANRIGNFHKKNDNNYSVPYDLMSDMHYSSKAFSANGHFTIVSVNPLLQSVMGMRSGLSHYDKLLANRMYPCISKWLQDCGLASDPCQNDGYTGSDCRCVCRTGTSGDNCETVDHGYYDNFIDDCSEEITTPGTITSTNYPNNYPSGQRCAKWILAPECHFVKVTFSAFNLYGRSDYCSGQSCCYIDFLEIRTTDLMNGTFYCDNDIEPGTSFTSPGDEMILFFQTSSSARTGWSAEVTFEPTAGCADTTTAECGQDIIDGATSHWTSPDSGDGNYPADAFCSITRSSSFPFWASVKFNHFELEAPGSISGICKDYVIFSRPFDMDSNELCGSQTGEIRLPSYNFVAEFESDLDVEAAGFNMTITMEGSNCHQLIGTAGVGSTGFIKPPRAANNAWETKACEWWIRSPVGTKIQFNIRWIRLSDDCTENSVIVNRSGDKSYPMESSSRHCGTIRPPQTIAEGNEMNVLFFSKFSRSQFKGKWTILAA